VTGSAGAVQAVGLLEEGTRGPVDIYLRSRTARYRWLRAANGTGELPERSFGFLDRRVVGWGGGGFVRIFGSGPSA
jgi:hypothetical protein